MLDQTVRVLPGFEHKYPVDDPKSFLWPRALLAMGRLHILFNALEEPCEDAPTLKWFVNMLVVICEFLSSTNTRRKFQRVCVCVAWSVLATSTASRGRT